jgi:hypothetical protein
VRPFLCNISSWATFFLVFEKVFWKKIIDKKTWERGKTAKRVFTGF